MFKNNVGILGILILSLIFLLGCTGSAPQAQQPTTNNILAPPKTLCADAIKGSLDYGEKLVAGKYTVTLDSIIFGSPNKVIVTVKDVVSGIEKKEVLTEGTPTDFMFGTSKMSVLFTGMDYVGGTKAKFEVCYDHPKACQTPIATGLIDYGDSLNVGGLYLIKINTITFGSPNKIQLDIFDANTAGRIATATFVEGVADEINLGAHKLTITASVDYSTGTKVKVSVCGDLPSQPQMCNPSAGVDSGTLTMLVGTGLTVKERYFLQLESSQEIMGKKFATISISDPYSDEFLVKKQKITVEEGKTVTVVVPGNNGGKGEVTFTVTKIHVDIVSSKSTADVVACAKLPPPVMCVPSVEETKSVVLGVKDMVVLNGKYQITFDRVEKVGMKNVVIFRLNDLVNIRQNFLIVNEGTSVDFAFSDTVLVLDVSLITFDAEGKPHVTLSTCAKGSGFGGGIVN